MTRGLQHLRAHAVGYLALFVALGGTGAWAADKITSKDIAKNAVRSKHVKKSAVRAKHIKARQVSSAKLDVVAFDRAGATVANPGAAGDAGFPDDPAINLRARRGDLLVVHARVGIRRDVGTGRCNVHLVFTGPAASLSTTMRFAASDSGAFETVYMDPFEASGEVSGTTSALASEAREIPVVEPGRYSFTFRYTQGNAGTDCSFRDRALWVGAMR